MTDDRNKAQVNKKAGPVRFIVSGIIFVLICGVILFGMSGLLQPKYYFASSLKSPETEMWENFYDLPENSLTTVFLGDSDVYCGVDAPRFNSLTGEFSFDMAVSSGSFMEGYYLLQEVLRFQKPDTVILDMNAVIRDLSKNELMSKRPYQDMKWSGIKWAAYTDENRALSKKALLKRIFTVFEYHDRWKELSDIDVHPEAYRTNVLGYTPCYEVAEGLFHNKFPQEEELEYNEIASVYFAHIAALCSENDIKLILIKTPKVDWNRSYSELAQGLADRYGLTYIDYNTDENFGRLGLDDTKDWRDKAHLNSSGAKKFTDVLAEDMIQLID